MKALALQDSQSIEIRSLAESLGHPLKVDRMLRDLWRVLPDPPEYEYVRSPVFQIHAYQENGFFAGDCDDSATLAGSLLVAMNQPCNLVAIRMPSDAEFSHVFLRCYLNGRRLDIDPIVPPEQIPIEGIAETMEISIL